MVYISIGSACNVKYQIDKHKHKLETLFFDWLMTSMNSVIEILSCNDIYSILYFDNIIRDINYPYHSNNSQIIIKSLNRCVSIHDISRNFTDKDIFEFIDKYKRRFDRIIQYIKSKEKIYFIRYGSVDTNDREKFIETILKINPNCNFALIIIDNIYNANDTNNTNNILKYEHCLYIKLNINKPQNSDWHTDYLNWTKIFLDIENNI